MPDAKRRLIGVTVLTLLYPAVAPLVQLPPNPMAPGAIMPALPATALGLLTESSVEMVAAVLLATSLRQFLYCSDRW